MEERDDRQTPSFLARLRAADEGVKRIITVVGTAVAMAIIVFMWISFFGVLPPAGEEAYVAAVAAPRPEGGFSFGDAARAAVGALFDAVTNLPQGWGNVLGPAREIKIKP